MKKTLLGYYLDKEMRMELLNAVIVILKQIEVMLF